MYESDDEFDHEKQKFRATLIVVGQSSLLRSRRNLVMEWNKSHTNIKETLKLVGLTK